MAKTIVQKVVFKNTTPKVLYNLYMDEKKHTMIAGAPCKMDAHTGFPLLLLHAIDRLPFQTAA